MRCGDICLGGLGEDMVLFHTCFTAVSHPLEGRVLTCSETCRAQPLFIQTFEKRGLLLSLPAAAIGQSGTMLNYRWQRKDFTSTRFQPWPDDSHLSGEPTSCFKRMDPSQSTAKVLFKAEWFEWFDWFLFLLVLTLLYSGCSVQLLTFRSGCTAAGAETAHLAAATATTGSRETFGS